MAERTDEQRMPLGLLATRLMRALEDEVFGELQRSGYPDIRPRHSALLTALEPDGARLSTLAARAGITAQAMGELVDDLERHGYLSRSPDPTDRRARLIRFTERGSEALTECLAVVARVEQRYADVLGQQRYDGTRDTLTELLAGLDETPGR